MPSLWPPLGPVGLVAPPAAVTIAASAWRWDGVSGTVLVSSGFPLTPGLVTAATLGKVRVYVGGVEQAIAIQALRGTWPDGSYRSLGLQFSYSLTHDTPVAASVVVDTVARGTTDITWTEPTKTIVNKRAVLAPTDPAYLCATHVTLQPLSPVASDTGVALAWNTALETAWAGGVATGQVAGSAIYDHPNGLWAYYCRTGVRAWYQAAYDWSTAFPGEAGLHANGDILKLLPYTLPPTADHAGCTNNGTFNPELLNGTNGSCGAPGEQYSLRLYSLASAYWMTAWRQPIRHVSFRANKALYLTNANGYTTLRDAWISAVWSQRFNIGINGLAAILTGYLVESTTGVATPGGYPAVTTWDYATYLPWTLDALAHYAYNLGGGDYREGVVGKRPGAVQDLDTLTPPPEDAYGMINFQISIVTTYLMVYYDYVTPDARIPGMLQTIANYLISQMRLSKVGESGYPTTYVHPYLATQPANVASVSAGPWTMPMFASVFAWVYAYTGNSTYLTWLDRCIAADNVAPSHLTMQTKIWGETWGHTQQSALYYRAGGAVRGAAGAHPSVITNPPIHASLG